MTRPQPSQPLTALHRAGDVPFGAVVTSVDELTALYRPPPKIVVKKKIDHVDDGCQAIIEAAPFLLMATADAHGRCTVSPKGGRPGFVRVLDEQWLVIPDYGGNNLVDSMHNLLVNPHVGLLFVLPGRDETLRVEGQAWITIDAALLDTSTDDGRRPRAAIGVRVESAFIHCAQSFRRGRMWDPATWEQLDAPAARDVFKGHLRITMPPDELPDWADQRRSTAKGEEPSASSSARNNDAHHT